MGNLSYIDDVDGRWHLEKGIVNLKEHGLVEA